jgi:hypothetical protein
MSVLGVAVVLVGLVAAVNLILTMALIRRLRALAERPAGSHSTGFPTRAVLPPGARVGEFAGTDADGHAFSHADLAGPVLAGFFTPGCEPCRLLLPRFVARAGVLTAGGWQVLAVVVVGPDEDAEEYRALLAPAARVVVEAPRGPVQRAFGAQAFPGIVLVGPDRTVVASGADPTVLDTVPTTAGDPRAAVNAGT